MNITENINSHSKKNPNKIALQYKVKGNYNTLTFLELENLSNIYANGLQECGFKKGDKTLLFIRPSLDFHAIVFALFKLGVIPILIDPGMGRKNLLDAISKSKPIGLIAEPEVHLLSLFFRDKFKSIKIKVSSKYIPLSKAITISSLKKSTSNYLCEDMDKDELAAILFTSGGTGAPKGVEYTHNIFSKQTEILEDLFKLNINDIDLPGFPLFSLFTLCIGMTSCIPNMDPSKPAKANPKKLVENINHYKCTFIAGSPAIWENVANYCIANNLKLPSVKYVVMFGAPVSVSLHKTFINILPKGTTYTPYGATESLPIANISGKIILNETASLTEQGKGTCVGKAVLGTDIKVIKISDNKISNINEIEELKELDIGEIIVQGDVVTKSYFNLIKETEISKIYDIENNKVWHRVGDLGYLDNQKRLWFCGRKSHRISINNKLNCSINFESIINTHQDVEKSAMINYGTKDAPKVGIAVILKSTSKNKENIKKNILDFALKNDLTKDLNNVFFCKKFPVDIRHNIKIDRLKLGKLASQGNL